MSSAVMSRFFLFVVFLVLVILTFILIEPFLTAIILALISVIVLRPLYERFLTLSWVHERRRLAASLTLAVFLLILVIPIYLVVRVALIQLSNGLEELATAVRMALESSPGFLASLPGEDVEAGIRSILQMVYGVLSLAAPIVANAATNFLSSLPSFVVQAVLFIAIIGTLLPQYEKVVDTVQRASPLGYDLTRLYNIKITAMVRSLVVGVFVIAIVQGLAMGFFFWLAGLPFVFLLTLIAIMLAIIPMLGISWLVLAIAAVSLLAGDIKTAAIVLLGFYGVVNWIDVILRPRLLSEEASLPILLFLLSVFGGLVWAGVMGLFYGPVIMLLLVTTINIYAELHGREDGEALQEVIRKALKRDEPVEEQPPEPAAE